MMTMAQYKVNQYQISFLYGSYLLMLQATIEKARDTGIRALQDQNEL